MPSSRNSRGEYPGSGIQGDLLPEQQTLNRQLIIRSFTRPVALRRSRSNPNTTIAIQPEQVTDVPAERV